MQFLHTWEWVIGISPHTGEPKTRTSRIQRLGEVDVVKLSPDDEIALAHHGYVNPNDNREIIAVGRWSNPGSDKWVDEKWRVGKTYAVQPARGVKSVGRIQICSITSQDVRNITLKEARLEGFYNKYQFLTVWTKMHDKPAYKANHDTDFSDGDESGMVSHSQGWMSWLKGQRPAERYQAWVVNFTLVKD